jgi:NRPS condensation-like uncharacterized protein
MNFDTMNSLNPTLRPLGALEEMFWLVDQHRPLHFLLAAEVTGSTQIEDWRRALDELQRRHPFLSVYIERNGESRPCFRQDRTITIPLRVIQGHNATERWESEAERELSIPFDPTQAPLVRAVLLHEAERSVCLFVSHHSVFDGRAVTFIIRDLLQALAGAALDPLPILRSHEEILGLAPEAKNDIVPAHQPEATDKQPSTFVDVDQLRPRIKSWPLTVELTTRLRVRARQEGTTVHGALSAACVLAYWEVSEDFVTTPVRIWCPIDTRRTLNLGDACALLTASAPVSFEPPDATTFWEMARTATARLRPAQRLENILASRRGLQQTMQQGLDVPAAAAMLARRVGHEILLTNLGNLSYATDFGRLRLEAVWGPIVVARLRGGQTIGVTTTNGALRLIQAGFAASDALLETVEEMLITACATRKHATMAQLPN